MLSCPSDWLSFALMDIILLVLHYTCMFIGPGEMELSNPAVLQDLQVHFAIFYSPVQQFRNIPK